MKSVYEEALLFCLAWLFIAVGSIIIGAYLWGGYSGDPKEPHEKNIDVVLEEPVAMETPTQETPKGRGRGHEPDMKWFTDIYAVALQCFDSDEFILPCGKDGCLRLREDAPACAIELWNRIDGRLDYGSQQSVKGSIVQKLRKRERL